MAVPHVRLHEDKNLGVLYTSYLDKRNPVTGSYKKRFAVLTNDALHWFKRNEGADLFGEERGQVLLKNVLNTRVLDEDSRAFEVQGIDKKVKKFRAESVDICEEWVSAIRSAIKRQQSTQRRPSMVRRSTLTGIRHIFDEEEANKLDHPEVTVLLVSLRSSKDQTELVLSRKPEWGREIKVNRVNKTQSLIISLSNGGTVTLSYDTMLSKAEYGIEFAAPCQNVLLASSLKIALSLINKNQNNDDKPTKKPGTFASVLTDIKKNRSHCINIGFSFSVIIAVVVAGLEFQLQSLALYVVSVILSVYNVYSIYKQVLKEQQSVEEGFNDLQVVLLGHHFTSPDEPVKDLEDEIPQRFIDGCDGDMREARRRWDITRHWRETEGVNNILNEPQPHFRLIKEHYPHYHAGRGKEGHLVFYERPGEFEHKVLADRGVTIDDLVRHWLFVTEYQWQIMLKGDETAKSIAVFDATNIKVSDLAGSNMDYVKKTIGYANQHYPERSYVILIINAPFFASLLWKIVKPLVHENTQKKVRILSAKESLKGMQEFIDFDQIAEYHGGGLDYGGKDSCRFNSPDTIAVNQYVDKLNGVKVPDNLVPFAGNSEATENSSTGIRSQQSGDWSIASGTTVGVNTPQAGTYGKKHF